MLTIKIGCVVMTLMLMAACGQSYEEKVRVSKAERQRLAREDTNALKVAVLPTLDGMPLFVAQEKGWLDTLGVDIRLKGYKAQMDCDEQLKAAKVEGAITDVKRVEHMRQTGTRLDTLGHTNAYWLLIANRTARVKQVGQLSDKMVAMTRYSATDFLTEKALEGVKLHSEVFRIQINDVTVRLLMLLNNEMDALWLTEPQATTAMLYKHNVLKDSRKMVEEPLGVLAFRQAVLTDSTRRKQLEVLVRGYNRACDSLNVWGLRNYADVVKVYCFTDDKTVQKLPNLRYHHLSKTVLEKRASK